MCSPNKETRLVGEHGVGASDCVPPLRMDSGDHPMAMLDSGNGSAASEAHRLPVRPGRRAPATSDKRLEAVASAVLTLAENGYDEVKMVRVAELAGISRASLYQHFSSRDDLIAFAIAVHAERIVPSMSAKSSRSRSASVRVQRVTDEVLTNAAARLPWTEAMVLGTSRADPALVAQIPNRRVEVLRDAIGDAMPDDRAYAAARTIELACSAVLLQLVGSGDLEESRRRMRVVVGAVLPVEQPKKPRKRS